MRFAGVMLAVVVTAGLSACAGRVSNPALAVAAYPSERHAANSVDIQVFRDDTRMVLVNATAHSYENFTLWLNQRYARDIDSLRAGQTIQLSLWGFYDVRGEVFNAGGFWRTRNATPLWLVEIQSGDGPMVGLIPILPDDD